MNPAIQALTKKWKRPRTSLVQDRWNRTLKMQIKLCVSDVQGSWVDLGSGAGFPELLCSASSKGTCSRWKPTKACFIPKRVIQESRLNNVEIYHGSENPTQTFDGVISEPIENHSPISRCKKAFQITSATVLLLGGDNPFVPRKTGASKRTLYTISTVLEDA